MEIGNIVILRNNDECIVTRVEDNDVLVDIHTGTYLLLEEYNDYNHLMEEIYDIMIVYDKGKVVWERSLYLKQEEKIILKCLRKDYKYIAKDDDGEIYIFTTLPQKHKDTWIIEDDDEEWSPLTCFDAFKDMPTTKAYKIGDLIK